ncbi:hypothetical protein SK128_010839 [Halocaridina rubra]|uniref:Uncharacterized protein n=1 Tax=Halocaridina rubra TaxID=373956 RepID=A0AAN8XNM6_HALRR
MRTTGLRRATVLAPRNAWTESSFAESTPRSSLNLEQPELTPGNKEHLGITLRVISENIPPKEHSQLELVEYSYHSLSDDSQLSTSVSPPPKPPRTFAYHSTPEKEKRDSENLANTESPLTPTALSLQRKTSKASEANHNSEYFALGSKPLIRKVISVTDNSSHLGGLSSLFYNTRSSIRSSKNISGDRIATSDNPIAGLVTGSRMAWRSWRRRQQIVPPSPTVSPPATPPVPPAQAPLNIYPSLPSGSHTTNAPLNTPRSGEPPDSIRPGPSGHRPAPGTSASQSQDARPNSKSLQQGPLSSPRKFEAVCIETLNLSRDAKSFMEKKQYNQAATQYQLALGYIDRILKTKVLEVTTHEPTRQRFFQMQEAVFAVRKECLNGFSDAQAAVALPQRLATTSPPPGAPPSYQDVLREDRRRTRGEPPPLPERPVLLSRPQHQSNIIQTQSRPRHTVQVQPQSQPQPLPSQPTDPQCESLTQSRTPIQPNYPSQVLIGASSSTEPQTPPRLHRRRPFSRNVINIHPLPDHEIPSPRAQLQSESSLNNMSQVSPQKSRQSALQSQVLTASERFSPINIGSDPQNQVCDYPTSKTELDHPVSQSDTSHWHENSLSQPKSRVPPKPLPRYSLPQHTQPLSYDHTQSSVKTQLPYENTSLSQGCTQILEKPISSEIIPEILSPKPQCEKSEWDVVSHGHTRNRRPAYLQNNNQPIGDLIEQLSHEKLEPKSTRLKVTSSPPTNKSDAMDTVPDETKNVSQTMEKKIRAFRFGPFNQKEMLVPVSKSTFYYNDQCSGLSFPENPPVIYSNKTHTDDNINDTKSTHEDSKKEMNIAIQAMPSKDICEKSIPTASTSHMHKDVPIPLPRTKKRVNEKNRILTSEESMKQSQVESSNSTPSKPCTLEMKADIVKKRISVDDPFATVDPFPLVMPNSIHNDILFQDNNVGSQPPILNVTKARGSDKDSSTMESMEKSEHPAVMHILVPQTIVQPVVISGAEKNLSDDKATSKQVENNRNLSKENFSDSILDALDCAVTPVHRRVSVKKSKDLKFARSHSQETLLDYSFNTLDRYLKSSSNIGNTQKKMCASRASIIEEFDPLISLAPDINDSKEEADVTLISNVEENEGSTFTGVPIKEENEEINSFTSLEENQLMEDYYAVPRKLKLAHVDDSCERKPDKYLPQVEQKSKFVVAAAHMDPEYQKGKYNDPASPYHIYAELGVHSSIASQRSTASRSLQENRLSTTSIPTPSTASTSEQDPWKVAPINDEESDEGQEVGRSAFYHVKTTDQSCSNEPSSLSSLPPLEGAHGLGSLPSTYRELLRIREGVKIFFIYEDGVITSPWNKPFLSVSKDSNKSCHGQSVLLCVGKSLWSCELISKETLVFKTETGTYIFAETNKKPDCVAVAVRVPRTVRKVQHDLFSRLMDAHSRLELERPSGITKSISKGAATAASRVNQLVGSESLDQNQAFIRRNSVRALKGMSKRLSTLAIKTGSTLPELPQEYECLQNAAETLKFSLMAKTVQYI